MTDNHHHDTSNTNRSEDTMTDAMTKTREAHDAYVANRKEAGRLIDIETCEYTRCYCNHHDPYNTYPWDDDPPDDEMSEQCRSDLSKCWFVWSDESDGWIEAYDLPEEKVQALQRRMEREDNTKTDEMPFWMRDDIITERGDDSGAP